MRINERDALINPPYCATSVLSISLLLFFRFSIDQPGLLPRGNKKKKKTAPLVDVVGRPHIRASGT